MNLNGIIKTILNAPEVTAICGDRVYPSRMPQNAAYPAVVTTQINAVGNGTKTSGSDADTIRVQVDCYASSMETSDTLAEAVRKKMEYFFGLVVVGAKRYSISSTVFLDTSNGWEDDKEIARTRQDYQIMISRTIENI